jgi:xanthine dehydrogenase accessory factor
MIKGELARRVEQLGAERVPFVLATVVRARHPRSVRPGDSALILGDGTIDGFVGGVCAQASVRLHALRALETGEPMLLRIVPEGPSDWDEHGGDEDAVFERNPCLSGGSLELLLEPQLPASQMLVVGDTPVARAVERVARAAGYDIVRDAGDAYEGAAAVVVASHGRDEERVLRAALLAGVPYVALVASAVRGEAVRASLDVPDELRAQLHTPAGLPLGGERDAEIAIAILAQLVATRHAHPRPAPVPRTTTAVDPVCGMEVAVTDASLHLDVDGVRVYFCSEHCRAVYAEEHERAGVG